MGCLIEEPKFFGRLTFQMVLISSNGVCDFTEGCFFLNTHLQSGPNLSGSSVSTALSACKEKKRK